MMAEFISTIVVCGLLFAAAALAALVDWVFLTLAARDDNAAPREPKP